MNKITDLALEYGFNSAVLTVSEISFDPQLRRYCEMNSCGCLGKNHMCPPLVGSPEQIAARIKNFDEFILLQKVFPLEDSFDFEGMTSAQSGFWTDFIKLTEQVRIYTKIQWRLVPVAAVYVLAVQRKNHFPAGFRTEQYRHLKRAA